MNQRTPHETVHLISELILAIRDREIEAHEGAGIARAASSLLDSLLPQCKGHRFGWVWRMAIHGARTSLGELAEYLDSLNPQGD
jgi:hypothetical protein